ncbi:hypothetical protein BDV18DRAFT_162902 [Aspergillus unguis]
MAKVALFGSTGQIGRSIVRGLLNENHNVVQVVRPASKSKAEDIAVPLDQKKRLTTVTLDVAEASVDELASALDGVYAVVSALNGKGLDAQVKIQDAADKAGVKRFYPSEYGLHHTYTDEKGYGQVHPAWNQKAEANRKALHHPAIAAGRMTYTLIGCGDFYDQDREPIWCPWTQRDAPSYDVHILGSADYPIDFTNIGDLGAFLAATISNPKASENKTLNFVSDRISYNDLVALWEKKSGKKVNKVFYPIETMDRAWKNPEDIPPAVKSKSPFPDDFWMIVKGMQGLGRFWRPPGEVHNDVFPEVKVTTFEQYFDNLFGK